MTHENSLRRYDFEYSIQVLEAQPIALAIYQPDGLSVYVNPAFATFTGVPREQIVQHYNTLQDPQLQQHDPPLHELFAIVLRGDTYVASIRHYNLAAERSVGTSQRAPDVWFQATLFPVHNNQGDIAYVGALHVDVTEQVQQQDQLNVAREELAEQRATIQELSSPVVQVWEGILTMPLVGTVDARRATDITENLLVAIVAYQADTVIIDTTGVAAFDTQVANYLLSTISACRLLGSEVALVGISSAAAQTIVQLGVSLEDVTTYANLQGGLAWAFARQNLTVKPR
jgi:PAS domain S-box-containing protein